MKYTAVVIVAGFSIAAAVLACTGDDPSLGTGTPAPEGGTSGGDTGTSGTSGTSGSSGTSGTSGTSGASGTSGDAGGGKRVFVSSTVMNGDLGGVTGADGKCQKLANDAKLGGTWRAWVSTPASTAGSRFTPSLVPYVRLDGVMVAASFAEMTGQGKLLAPIKVDETKATVIADASGKVLVWTNTGVAGDSQDTNLNCGGWSALGSAKAIVGDALKADNEWTTVVSAFPACTSPLRIYCFEQ